MAEHELTWADDQLIDRSLVRTAVTLARKSGDITWLVSPDGTRVAAIVPPAVATRGDTRPIGTDDLTYRLALILGAMVRRDGSIPVPPPRAGGPPPKPEGVTIEEHLEGWLRHG
jgi:hypothetical protein